MAAAAGAGAGGRSALEREVMVWARPQEMFPQWASVHDAHVAKLARARASGALRGGLLLLGDSITEGLTGRCFGEYDSRCRGIPEVFTRHWQSRWRADAVGIAADTASHLAWRLLHGESPRGLGLRVVMLLIGINDLGEVGGGPAAAANLDGVVQRISSNIIDIARLVLEKDPGLHVALHGILPTGLTPGMHARADEYLSRINSKLREFADTPGAQERVTYIYGGDALLNPSGDAVDPQFAPDGLHPSAAGWEALSRSIVPQLEPLMGAGDQEQA